METYQMHDDHGRHIAYNGAEAKANNENGWKNVTKKEFYNIGDIIDVVAVEVEDGELSAREKLVIAYEMKFGKKPHHMLKDETVQAKLDE
jgi:hypothetical protein